MYVPQLCEVTTRYNMENRAVLNVLYRLEHYAIKYYSDCFRIFSPLTFSYLLVLHLFCCFETESRYVFEAGLDFTYVAQADLKGMATLLLQLP